MSTPPDGETKTHMALSALRGPQPLDRSVEMLLVTLAAKLEMHSRLRVWAHEATRNGCPECVGIFHAVAESDRAQIDQLLAGLGHHLRTSESATSVATSGRSHSMH